MSKRSHVRVKQQPKEYNRPFLAFTIKHTGRASRIITPVKVTEAFDPQTTPSNQVGLYETKALWDTGATNSVVTETTAKALGLIPIGSAIVHHAGGSSTNNRYLINVYLPNLVAIIGVMVCDMPENSGDFGLLIGMDIITGGDLCISNSNQRTWVSFRFPSYQGTDYVIESDQLTYKGAHPNQPCPCGRKDSFGKPIPFRNCHGKHNNSNQ